jgi:hypothetical protein
LHGQRDIRPGRAAQIFGRNFDTNFLIQTVVAGSAAHEKFRGLTPAQEDCNASSIYDFKLYRYRQFVALKS